MRQLVSLSKPDELVDLIHDELANENNLSILSSTAINLLLDEHKFDEANQQQLARPFPHADLLTIMSQPIRRPENNKSLLLWTPKMKKIMVNVRKMVMMGDV